jgi:hypothetical protein
VAPVAPVAAVGTVSADGLVGVAAGCSPLSAGMAHLLS